MNQRRKARSAMFLIVISLCCLVSPFAYVVPWSFIPELVFLAPLIAVNLVAAWAGIRGGKLYRRVLPYVAADVVATAFVLLPVSLVQTRTDVVWIVPIASI